MPAQSRLQWSKLLSRARHMGDKGNQTSKGDKLFHEHQRDADRILFSSSFRRLQGKTQVFIFPETDYVRNRLTHTLEVMSISRALTTAVIGSLTVPAREEMEDGCKEIDIEMHDIIEIVSAASSVHDIGNAPFGHIGEYAIRSWFDDNAKNISGSGKSGMSSDVENDYKFFDGNPQGFRVVTKLQGWPEENGGMQLTCATIAAAVKYPFLSNNTPNPGKFGFYSSETNQAISIFGEVGLYERVDGKHRFWRHPLSYLVEAADDIAYLTSDLDDGVKYGLLGFQEVYDLLRASIPQERLSDDRCKQTRREDQDKIKLLRSAGILTMVEACENAFITNYEKIMRGTFRGSLLEAGALAEFESNVRSLVEGKIYYHETKVRKEAAAYYTVRNLLDEFSEMIEEYFEKPKLGLNAKNKNIRRIIQPDFEIYSSARKKTTERPFASDKDEAYARLVDYVSGMTDAYARNLSARISGREF